MGSTLVSVQVDEQSVFRHRGERKVKTIEEDVRDVSSRAAELEEEEEELIGSARKRNDLNRSLSDDWNRASRLTLWLRRRRQQR